jgi:hypothetical protein
MVGSCEHYDELSGSIKCREFDQLSNCQLLKEDTTPWSYLVSYPVS